MKKIILTLLSAAAFSFTTLAQTQYPQFKLSYTGFVGQDSTKSYNIIELKNKKQSELYKSTLTYINSIYNNPAKVITSVENESIVINALTNDIQGDLSWFKYSMRYHIKLLFKDGKIKIEPSMTDLIEDNNSNRQKEIFLSDTNSQNPGGINYIWMHNNGKYFLFETRLNASIEKWINNYTKELVDGISKSDW